jgi:hypothetical protein
MSQIVGEASGLHHIWIQVLMETNRMIDGKQTLGYGSTDLRDLE